MAKKKIVSSNEEFVEIVHRRTKTSLIALEEQFPLDHANDTNEQLVAYLQNFSKELGRAPNQSEIIGGRYIAQQFGGWRNALAAAGLFLPRAAAQTRNRLIYRKEYDRQTVLLEQALIDDPTLAKELKLEDHAAMLRRRQARHERDMAWGHDHESDTDEQLLDYVRQCAAEQGEIPNVRETVGGKYLVQRFGDWQTVLLRAGLKNAAPQKP